MIRRKYLWMGGAGILLAGVVLALALSEKQKENGQILTATTKPVIAGSVGTAQPPIVERKEEQGRPTKPGEVDSDQLAHDITACLRSTDADERQRKFFDLIAGMRPEDGPKIRAVFLYYDQFGRTFSYEWGVFWRTWAKLDPQGALVAAAKEPAGRIPSLYNKILQSWGAADPAAASQWLNQNSSNPGYDEAFLGFVNGYAEKDVMNATSVVLKTLQADDPLFGKALERLSSYAAEKGSGSGVQDWFNAIVAQTQGNPEMVSQAALNAAAKISHSSMADAAAFVSTQSTLPWRSDAAIGYLSFRYSQTDPAADAAWIASLPPAKGGSYVGVKELIANWSQSTDALEKWLGEQQGAPLFKQAVNQYIQKLGDQSPEKTAFWKQQLAAGGN